MSLDPYSLCPGGTNKKVKFCGCKDIVHQLDEVTRKLEGDQRASAMEQLDRLLAKHPNRACLLTLKSKALLELGEFEAAKPSIGTFVVQHPENPTALALSALLEVSEGEVADAVVALQRALEFISGSVPRVVYQAMVFVTESLFRSGQFSAARAHALTLSTEGSPERDRMVDLLMRIHGSESISLFLKEDFRLVPPPDQAEYADRFAAAIELGRSMKWLAAAEKLEALSQEYPQQPAILRNIAILRSWLGDAERATIAWRRLAQLDQLPLDAAVEAEAQAQILDPESIRDRVDLLNLTIKVKDAQRLLEVFASDRRLSRLEVDLRQLASSEDQPPPKAAYWLLNRPLPTSAPEIALEDVPVVLGEVYLYGKQTDREAQIEFSAARSDDLEQKLATLREIAGSLLDDDIDEEVVDQVGAMAHALTWRWRFPNDTRPEHRRKLAEQQWRVVLLDCWPKIRMSVLGGHAPRDVAGDPAYRIRLLAAILRLEVTDHQRHFTSDDFNELRVRLGLPRSEKFEPGNVDLESLPLSRLHRIETESLTDDQLEQCFTHAVAMGAMLAMRLFAEELTTRESFTGNVKKRSALLHAFEVLSRMTRDNDRALEYLKRARNLALDEGQAAAPWLLDELNQRLARGVADGCQNLIEQIQSRHIKEPGVAQSLYEILVDHGVISPDGQLAAAAGETSRTEPEEVAAPAAEPTSKIWTPDSPSNPAQSGEGKSKLWVPDTE